jgi:hypothetical protein
MAPTFSCRSSCVGHVYQIVQSAAGDRCVRPLKRGEGGTGRSKIFWLDLGLGADLDGPREDNLRFLGLLQSDERATRAASGRHRVALSFGLRDERERDALALRELVALVGLDEQSDDAGRESYETPRFVSTSPPARP